MDIFQGALVILVMVFSLIVGYLLGLYTEEEIETTADRIKIDKIFGYPFIVSEAVIIGILYYLGHLDFTLSGIIALFNMFSAAMYTAKKSDLPKIVNCCLLLLIISLVFISVVSI